MTAKKKPGGGKRVTVADLERRVTALETRLALLEGRVPEQPPATPSEPAPPAPPQANP